MLIKGFSTVISCGHSDEGMGAILAISVVGHPRNISVRLFEMEQLAYEEMSFKDILFSGAEGF